MVYRDAINIRTGWHQAMGDNEWFVHMDFPEVGIVLREGKYHPAWTQTGEPIGGHYEYFDALLDAAKWLYDNRQHWLSRNLPSEVIDDE